MQTIKTIIFDLGGVLIDWNPNYVFEKKIPDADKRKFFFENICTFEWNEQQDEGRTIKQGNQVKIKEFPEWESEILAYYSEWPNMLGDAIKGTLDVFEKLKQSNNYTILALTNWSAETFPIAKAMERFSFLNNFDGIVVSGTEKVMKPNPKIFEILFERYNVKPQEAVFIDDNNRNIIAGNKMGLNTIHFQNPSQMIDELKNFGIIMDI
ncbi:MAG: HAD family phosphatase [Pseudarcicella sp.]|nr:HAD family phosphatase [Pseudarcicella sp.]MBP6411365.1 HAD family phosphatase [Pseudarcicella sp.]